jgi:hypothetical protein
MSIFKRIGAKASGTRKERILNRCYLIRIIGIETQRNDKVITLFNFRFELVTEDTMLFQM